MMCAKLRIMVRKSYYENSLNDVSLTDCYEFLVEANVFEFLYKNLVLKYACVL